MRLALVPETAFASNGVAIPGVRPSLPDWLHGPGMWGQASSAWRGTGMVLVWLNITESEAVTAAREGVGIVGPRVRWTVGNHGSMRRPDPRGAALVSLADDVRRFGSVDARRRHRELHDAICASKRSSEMDFVAAYREVAASVERDHSRVIDGVNALTTISSDGFSGSNGSDVNGRTMDAAGGGSADTWTVHSGAFDIQSNRLNYVSGSDFPRCYDSSMSAVDRLRVTILVSTTYSEPYATTTADKNNGYSTWSTGGWLMRWSGATSYAFLGSAGTSATSGDTSALDCDGSSISSRVNGVVQCGPVTDSTYATRIAGLLVWATDTRTADDWIAEGADPPPPANPRNILLTGVGG